MQVEQFSRMIICRKHMRLLIIIIMTFYVPTFSMIELSGKTKPRD